MGKKYTIKALIIILVLALTVGCSKLPLEWAEVIDREIDDTLIEGDEKLTTIDLEIFENNNVTEGTVETFSESANKGTTEGVSPKPVKEKSAALQKPTTEAYASRVEKNVNAINNERQKLGLAPLKVSKDLTEVALWAAREHVQGKFNISSHQLQEKIKSSYPNLAILSSRINLVTATGSYTEVFVDKFTAELRTHVNSSDSLRNNVLNPDMGIIGAALVGEKVLEGGREQYKLSFVWIVMPTPPQEGISTHEDIALKNIAILNEERSQRGLNPLEIHSDLMELAYLKAKDMIMNDYFDHNSVNLGTPHEMITAVVRKPQMTAENLWKVEGMYHSTFFDGTAERAHEGLMNSEGHRKNLLQPDFTHVGVAAVAGIANRKEGSVYQLVIVQLFIRR